MERNLKRAHTLRHEVENLLLHAIRQAHVAETVSIKEASSCLVGRCTPRKGTRINVVVVRKGLGTSPAENHIGNRTTSPRMQCIRRGSFGVALACLFLCSVEYMTR